MVLADIAQPTGHPVTEHSYRRRHKLAHGVDQVVHHVPGQPGARLRTLEDGLQPCDRILDIGTEADQHAGDQVSRLALVVRGGNGHWAKCY
ncbi:hypothetical protein D3C78_1476050 [compost metagenome]